MEPEEIDKLFRDRLSGLPATPSPDAWLRLQQKMEPAKKERTMWVYYAAASISIILLSGLFFFGNLYQDNNVQVAQTEIKGAEPKTKDKNNASQATSAPNPASTSETKETIARNSDGVRNEEKEKIKKINPLPEPDARQFAATVAKVKPMVKSKGAPKGLSKVKSTEDATPVLVQTGTPVLPEGTVKNTFTQNNATTATTNVVQVVVKLGNSREGAYEDDEEPNLRESISRKGALLKNIYLQARNLKNGDPVELASLGVDTEKINTEKENIKQKINKAISF